MIYSLQAFLEEGETKIVISEAVQEAFLPLPNPTVFGVTGDKTIAINQATVMADFYKVETIIFADVNGVLETIVKQPKSEVFNPE